MQQFHKETNKKSICNIARNFILKNLIFSLFSQYINEYIHKLYDYIFYINYWIQLYCYIMRYK